MTKKVLLIDNNEDILSMLTHLLRGYEISSTANPFDGLALYYKGVAEKSPFALIIVDGAMPEMSGFHIAETIRRTDVDVKMALLTAFAVDDESRERASRSGIDVVWRKPEDSSRIPELVKGLIGT